MDGNPLLQDGSPLSGEETCPMAVKTCPVAPIFFALVSDFSLPFQKVGRDILQKKNISCEQWAKNQLSNYEPVDLLGFKVLRDMLNVSTVSDGPSQSVRWSPKKTCPMASKGLFAKTIKSHKIHLLVSDNIQ